MPLDKHALGARIATLRKAAGLSQRSLATSLNVTDKAVSKWENGAAFPSMESIVKLSDLLDIEVGELFAVAEHTEKRVTVIALSGGPCAGKTSSIGWVTGELAKHGFRVVIVPETATELISGGVTPATCASRYDFQKSVCTIQLTKEDTFISAARHMNAPAVVLCDRGVVDCRGFLTPEEYARLLREMRLSSTRALERYDAVFHLQTAASLDTKGAYSLDSNAARTETPDEARDIDQAIALAWGEHKHAHEIIARDHFADKRDDLLTQVNAYLHLGDPFLYERIFLIRRPPDARMDALDGCIATDVETFFLTPRADQRMRYAQIRKDVSTRQTTCWRGTEVTKTTRDAQPLVFDEHISTRELSILRADANPNRAPVHKTRRSFPFASHYMHVDTYPFFPYAAVLHVEVAHPQDHIAFPSWCSVIREVTHEQKLVESQLARAVALGRL